MARAVLDATPGLPKDRDGPVFAEPWQAQAFALTVKLHQAGHFEWAEWVRYLSREIAAGTSADADGAETVYYLQWLAALEKLVADKGLSTAAELKARKSAWHAAYEATAHGRPVTLEAAHHGGHDRHH
jgi:nitrile hydratase accessory protein